MRPIDRVVLGLIVFAGIMGAIGGIGGGFFGGMTVAPEMVSMYTRQELINFAIFSSLVTNICFIGIWAVAFLGVITMLLNEAGEIIDALFILPTYLLIQVGGGVVVTIQLYGTGMSIALLTQLVIASSITLIMVVGYIAFRRRAATYYDE